ncbi:AcrR family transcriptional regulator [Arthrobacter stackebrandtii]|uniref:AcrR family transcriptional regulator n=1 Tax=Arthrobacter stackebrandtii TaxID=272161 RepID=A0ABS4YZL8_9MICC|nr:TetR/AcrR family transcriptional regulator [Arthrobacter stackebrandtii]MBP2414186.1 AcrR family transcriptional regulator [Arthrobacter stackebrandtii]PYG98950.1 TetR/AcrR family transcriptional regulator [Arthrobacter stackebrandtii]
MVETAGEAARPGRRQAQSRQTRELIVTCAGELFLANGYMATSIEAVATRAGVAIQTIYNSVGNKPALLSAVLDAAVAGPNAPATVPEFMRERVAKAADVAGVVGVLADWFAEGMPRSQAVFTIISQAAAVDPAVAVLREQRAAQRLANYRLAAAAVRARGGLANGMDDDSAAAAIFAVGHPDSYATLVAQFGWSLPHYRDWIHASLLAILS